jgi:hypothetical protein
VSTAVSAWHGSDRLGALRLVGAGMASLGSAWHVLSGLGAAGPVRHAMSRPVKVRRGWAGSVWPGALWRVAVWQGPAGTARFGMVGCGWSWRGAVGPGRHGKAPWGQSRLDAVRLGAAGQARFGSARLNAVGRGWAGMARLGLGGPSGHGTSGLGQAGAVGLGRFWRVGFRHVVARPGPAGSVRYVAACHGPALQVTSRQARPVRARCGGAWPVTARQVGAGSARHCGSGQRWARPGRSWHDMAGR